MYVLTPTYKPVGGVIKLFDYALHARNLGWHVVVCCPEPLDGDAGVLAVPGLESLAPGGEVAYRSGFRFGPSRRDVVLISWPAHYGAVAERLGIDYPHRQVVHLLQNVRHANPAFAGGYALRLLGRPLSRIALSDEILAAVRPHLHPDFPAKVIPLGHRTEYFTRERSGGFSRPIRVAYTTWKSDLGERLAARLTDDRRFEFRGVGGVVGWPQLRELYHWADVFLATPGAQEGHYLPGMEAMAAGAVVVTPDVGGNRAYCDFDVNCLLVPYEDEQAYAAALTRLADTPVDAIERLRTSASAEAARHRLGAEHDRFGAFLDEIVAG